MHMTTLRFEPAYKRLTVSERKLADAVIRVIEMNAHRAQERISAALERDWDIPTDLIDEESRDILTRPLVQNAIYERLRELANEQELTVHRWQKEVMAISFSNMQDYIRFEPDGFGNDTPMLDLRQCTPEQMAAIKSLEIETPSGNGLERGSGKTKVKITLWDKPSGLDRLGRFIGAQDSNNPYWNGKGDGTHQRPQLPQNAGVEDAGEAYQRMLES